MVDTSVALASIWTDHCTIYTMTKTLNSANKRTEFSQQPIYTNQPCRLSFKAYSSKAYSSAKENNDAYYASQTVVLFINKDIAIPAGSKVVVTSGENIYTYANSGRPIVHSGHQEIVLQLFQEYA